MDGSGQNPNDGKIAGWVPSHGRGVMAPRFGPGNNANPAGKGGLYRECQQLARTASPSAMNKLVALMDSPDERVALMAADKVLERAWGKPKEQSDADRDEMSKRLNLQAFMAAASDEELVVLKAMFGRMQRAHAAPMPMPGGDAAEPGNVAVDPGNETGAPPEAPDIILPPDVDLDG